MTAVSVVPKMDETVVNGNGIDSSPVFERCMGAGTVGANVQALYRPVCRNFQQEQQGFL
jgi:hypothetical protein